MAPEPALDPSIIKQKSKKNLDSYCFITFLWLFIFENYVLKVTDENSRILIHWSEVRLQIRTKMSRIHNIAPVTSSFRYNFGIRGGFRNNYCKSEQASWKGFRKEFHILVRVAIKASKNYILIFAKKAAQDFEIIWLIQYSRIQILGLRKIYSSLDTIPYLSSDT